MMYHGATTPPVPANHSAQTSVYHCFGPRYIFLLLFFFYLLTKSFLFDFYTLIQTTITPKRCMTTTKQQMANTTKQ